MSIRSIVRSGTLAAALIVAPALFAQTPATAQGQGTFVDGVQVLPASTVQVVTPSTVSQVVTPGAVRNVVTPGAISNVVTPGAITNVVTPGAISNVVTPGAITNVVTPGAMQNVVTPGTVQNVVSGGMVHQIQTPSTVHQVQGPSTVHQVQDPSTVHNVVTPGSVQHVVTGGTVVSNPTVIHGASSAVMLASPVVGTRWGYSTGNVITFADGTSLAPNMNGTVYSHPSFPGRNLFWNRLEARWCYQDRTSSTGWRFLPDGISIPRPQ